MERHLAAILAADVVGYSALMERDEAGTFARLKAGRKQLFEPEIERHHGRIFKLMGDGLLAEFTSVVDAVECAVALQRGLTERDASVPEDERFQVRIGVNLGEVIVDGEDRYGEGVNIAARLEELAEPGGIYVSGKVSKEVEKKLAFGFEPLGERQLKNIAEPLSVYRVLIDASAAAGARHVYRIADTPSVAAPRMAEDKPSIAVLPYENMSGDPGQQYFSDGITEDIITDLSRFRSLVVVARNSSFQFRGKGVDVRRIGRDLGVQYVVEGSVRKSADRLRITTQLIECAGGMHLWSERYDFRLTDLFAIQDEVVQSIVSSVAGQVSGAAFKRARRKRTEHLGAYDCLLHAMEWHRSTGPEADEECRRWYEKALELDPNCVEALGGLAVNALNEAFYSDAADRFERPLALATKAVALDPNNSWSHCALGLATMWGRSLAAATSHIETAVRLNPNDADQLMYCSSYYFFAGQFDVQRRLILAAKRLNPLPPSWYRFGEARSEYHQRNYEAAAQLLERMGTSPNYWVHNWLAACYVKLGKMPEAKREVAKALKLRGTLTLREIARMPFAKADDRNHLVEPLREAGMPE
jgi:TolB-like protein/class 3 adenylate cyclase/cytochrome c-type biogenesis protein CcmH/NrfG